MVEVDRARTDSGGRLEIGRSGLVCAALFALALAIGLNAAILNGGTQSFGIYHLNSITPASGRNQNSDQQLREGDAHPIRADVHSPSALQVKPIPCEKVKTQACFFIRRMLGLKLPASAKSYGHRVLCDNQPGETGP